MYVTHSLLETHHQISIGLECKTLNIKLKQIHSFSISPMVFETFGFHPSARVMTPKGPGSVLGVYAGDLWFLLDKDKGASFWVS